MYGGLFYFCNMRVRKIISAKAGAFILSAIFAFNMTALCGCRLAQTSLHKNRMDKGCCCCSHRDQEKNNKCKTGHALSFDQLDKNVANTVSMQIAAAHFFLVSVFISLPENNFATIRTAYHLPKPFPDNGPPDLRTMYRSFLI